MKWQCIQLLTANGIGQLMNLSENWALYREFFI